MGQQDVAARLLLAICACTLAGCAKPGVPELRAALANQRTGAIELPSGTFEISSELVVPAGAHDLDLFGPNTILKRAPDFSGRALLVVEQGTNITLRDFTIDGSRPVEPEGPVPFETAPPENAFRVWYKDNGILADQVDGLEIIRLDLHDVVHFPILVSRSQRIRIHEVTVTNSGNLNAMGRNNLSGGILIEEGSSDFEVRNSTFHGITGNALWTHSLFTSPRNSGGVFSQNTFETIGRDALQVGHATNVRVEFNTGDRIGYPIEVVDIEHDGTPVAIDTAGDVDHSEYASNTFREVNGKCIDLDGFHDGVVRGNSCVNPGRARDYPSGHFGIVMNNTYPGTHANNVEIRGNTIDGTKFGGLFLMGSGNTIVENRFLHVNLAGCNETAAEFGCIYKPDEPEMLESGIYLGRGVARLEATRDNVIRGNEIRGHKMGSRCIAAGPGVSLAANTLANNICADADTRQ